MKYQLVVQCPETMYDDLDWIENFENRLDELLIEAEVDGHDIGSGEVNIFIHTNKLNNSFEIAKHILEEDGENLESIKIAYREIGKEDYTPLWPQDLKEFNVI